MRFLIKNGRVWDGEKFFFADVVTEDGVVSKIVENFSGTADFVYDAAGKIVSAGLVDIHAHFQGVSEDSIGISAEMSCLPFGVTAACDAGAALGDEKYLQGLLVKNAVFPVARILEDKLDEISTEARIARYGHKVAGIKLYLDAGSKNIDTGAPLRQVCDFAQKRGLKVCVHINGTPISMAEAVEILRPGDILTHAFHGGKNTAAEDGYACLKKAKEKGIVVDAGFAGTVHTDLQIFYDAVAAGVYPDTLSTDITCFSAFRRGGRYGMTMCMNLARDAGMPEEEIFRSVTTAAAKAVGMPWGRLYEGGAADLAVFAVTDEGFDLTDEAGNHRKSAEGYRCVLTILDGKLVYRY